MITKKEAMDMRMRIMAECSNHRMCDEGCPFYSDKNTECECSLFELPYKWATLEGDEE